MDGATRTAALVNLEPLVGEWSLEARFTFTREPVPGRSTFAWELGGEFLTQRSAPEHPDAPDSVALLSVAEAGDGHGTSSTTSTRAGSCARTG